MGAGSWTIEDSELQRGKRERSETTPLHHFRCTSHRFSVPEWESEETMLTSSLFAFTNVNLPLDLRSSPSRLVDLSCALS